MGTAADRLDLLAIVEAQFEDVYRELDKQRKQTSQLQAQVDELAAHIRRLTNRLGAVIDRLQGVVDAATTRLRTSPADRTATLK
jgi:septal ring factor EnvC (AmiA/AmiB activator)